MVQLSTEFRKFAVPSERDAISGADAFVHSSIGWFKRLAYRPSIMRRRSRKIHARSLELAQLSMQEFEDHLEKYRELFRRSRVIGKSSIEEALAIVCEASHRALGMRPYDVQIMGALAQVHNFAIEMLPGEGKTITAAVSAVIAAWRGKPCHVVTSNDYLAKRDAEIMEPLFHQCKLKVGYVIGELESQERAPHYRCDVVYSTSKELLADFLRDQLIQDDNSFDAHLIRQLRGQHGSRDRVMQGLFSAIVDEADSVLCDEATTPLIISANSENDFLKDASITASHLVKSLIEEDHYKVDRKFQDIELTEEGNKLLDEISQDLPRLWQARHRRSFLIQQALAAREFYHRNTHYIIDEEEKVVIIDEKTGRMMEHRTWGNGLHQAIEAKEEVELSDPTETHTRMSFQRFFRLYQNLSGMSGTLQSLERELWLIYRLPVMRIPKRIPNRYDLPAYQLHLSKEAKWQAVVDEVRRVHETGRPILVGTRSIEESELVHERLTRIGLNCVVLHALHHAKEAGIVEMAGQRGAITIATNMAGRGTDIILDEEVISLGGLHVIATQRHESRRVDLQLFGRAARQGQPGSVQRIYSLEDELIENLAAKWMKRILQWLVRTQALKGLAYLIYSFFQRESEKRSSKVRAKILEKDFSLNEMMSFVK